MTTSETSSDDRRVWSIVPQSILAWLCHYANADPSHFKRSFYDLKGRLLRQYARFEGHDVQEITKECWGERDGWGDPIGCKGEGCRRCGGTGIYDRKWIRLQRWRWGRYVFHIPDGLCGRPLPNSLMIHGRIEHPDYGLASREAELWLYIVTLQFGTWWGVLSTSCYCKPRWWPMCRLQGWAMWARMNLHRQRCPCGKRFLTWGSGWMVCKQCRVKPTVLDDDDVPF